MIRFQIEPDGKLTIWWPKGEMPDRQTIERLQKEIQKRLNKGVAA